MRRPLLRGILFATLAASPATACGSDPVLPTEPTPPPLVTETFTGTLTLNGAFTFPFPVAQAGSATLTITSLAPHTTIRVRDGAGNFVVGETVFVGANVGESTASATVHGWDPQARRLLIINASGTFTVDAVIVGEQSGASWTAEELTPTTVGIAMGVWNGAVCDLVLVNDNAFRNDFILGVTQGAGNLCARVYDPGRLQFDIAFGIEVTHF